MYVFNFNCVLFKWLNSPCYAQAELAVYFYFQMRLRDLVIAEFQQLIKPKLEIRNSDSESVI